jgi:thymidylate synthase (FAD)
MSTESEELKRPRASQLDEILGSRFNVLDDGFIRVVDYMGTDESIVQAARVSYGKGTKKLHEDRGLIRYLMRHRHTTPFEMCEIKFHVRVPMDCWRQWIRHRTANVNEYSTRYSEAIDAAQTTPSNSWRLQAKANRQGSGDCLDLETGEYLTSQEKKLQETARKLYEERLSKGVAREQARKDLPLSTYTEAYWKIDLHNLFHFLSLRMDARAQSEIRSYATIIGNEIVAKWCPFAWEAFVDYQLNSVFLTRLEKEILAQVSQGNLEEARRIASENGLLPMGEKGLKRNRERDELESKLTALGLVAPWQGNIPTE